MSTVLESIIAGVREDLAERERLTPLPTMAVRARAASGQRPPVDVVPLLHEAATISLISEVKRSSPSKGRLAEIPNPAELAAAYERAGASAVSVLTEQRRFGGSLDDLDAVRSRVRIPVLRKDFTVTEYQIHEARAHGADIILLIVAALSDQQLADLFHLTRSLGMRALVETHTEDELERALELADAQLIGVNARNLKTLELDLPHAAELVSQVPADRIAIGESAVLSRADVETYASAGADAVLVGEALVTNGSPEQTAREFCSVPRTSR